MYKSCVVVGLFFFNFLLFSNFYVSPLHAGHTNLLCPVPVSVCALPKRAVFRDCDGQESCVLSHVRPESTSRALFSSTAGGSQTASRHQSIWLECFHQASEVLDLPGNCGWSSYFVYKEIISESIFPFPPLISELFLIFCRQWFRRVGAPRVYSGLSRESTVLVLPR